MTHDNDYSSLKTIREMKIHRVYAIPIIKKDELCARCGQVKVQIYTCHLKRVFQPNDITSKLYIAQCQSPKGVYKNIKQLTSIETK